MKFEKTDVVGFEHAIRGMRNPLESWDKSDSHFTLDACEIGSNDLELMKKLAKAGTDHGKFLRFIVAYVDITAPLYWWKQFMTYRHGVEVDSCSTMHTLHKRKLYRSDFELRDLFLEDIPFLDMIIDVINKRIDGYNIPTQHKQTRLMSSAYKLLPECYLQKRTCMISYAALRNMYHARRNHKLHEWHDFCEWVETLPCSELITEE